MSTHNHVSFRSFFLHHTLAVALLLAFSGSGCIDMEDADFDLDDELGEASQAVGLVDDDSVSHLPAYGGWGGAAFPDTYCPPGYVATGLELRTGDWVDQIKMTCRELRADGTLGATAWTDARGGSGGWPNPGGCDNDQIMVGQIVGADAYVGRLGGQCASISQVMAGISGSQSTFGPLGGQGALHDDTCPPGQAIVGFHGRAGAYVDRVGSICKGILLPQAELPVSSNDDLPITIEDAVVTDAWGLAVDSVAAGSAVTLHVAYTITQASYCPSCIDQIIVGIAPSTPLGCVYDGIPSPNGTSGSGRVSFTAPSTPGVYAIRFMGGMAYSCDLSWWSGGAQPGADHDIFYLNVY